MNTITFTVVCLASLLVAASFHLDTNELWSSYKAKFQKKYADNGEEELRKQNWLNNLEKIRSHNARYDAGEVSHYLRETKFSDMTEQEFLHMIRRGSLKTGALSSEKQNNIVYQSKNPNPEKAVDWRTKGAVNAIKDQGQCGSCWAFSAVTALESQYFLTKGVLKQMAEQQLVDCDTQDDGCEGGLPSNAFEYFENYSPMKSVDYPYKAEDGRCKYSKKKSIPIQVSSIIWAKSGDEQALQQLVAQKGPVSVGIDASSQFQNYGGGVLKDTECGNQNDTLNHGVAVIGYGTTDKHEEYYIVRNSWGTDWGMNGYILMARNQDNMCGISNIPCLPAFKSDAEL